MTSLAVTMYRLWKHECPACGCTRLIPDEQGILVRCQLGRGLFDTFRCAKCNALLGKQVVDKPQALPGNEEKKENDDGRVQESKREVCGVRDDGREVSRKVRAERT